HLVVFQAIELKGVRYDHFMLGDCPDKNLLGLRYLSRYRATLNFPEQTLFLQPGGASFSRSH
ncbi:MAG: hypothetical protein WCH43_16605, partial [Verrucomicrobiota bacterium]